MKERFRNWQGNIGIVCGPRSDLVVIDIDLPDGPETLKILETELGPLPPTLIQRTGGGGRQLFYRYPQGRTIKSSAGTLGVNVDGRANDGQVVVFPSIHPNGSPYTWINSLPPADLPDLWINHLEKHSKATKKVQNNIAISPDNAPYILDNACGLHPYVAAALQNAVLKIAEAAEGTRNDTAFKELAQVAGFVASGLLDKETLRAQAEAAFQQCHPKDFDPKEFEATFNSAFEAGVQTPRTVAAPLPPGFSLIKSGPKAGLLYEVPARKEDDPPVRIRLGAPLEVLELVRDGSSEGWGRRVKWYDPDGVMHCRVIPDELLAGNESAKWLSLLASGGWVLQGGGRNGVELLKRYLTNCQPTRRLKSVPRTGWTEDCLAFTLPDKVIPEAKYAEIILQFIPNRNPYIQAGSLEEWQNTIGRWCEGNSRFLFAICTALAGPLLYLLGQESGGFNLTGQSSSGKTTCLLAAGSVWGSGASSGGYVQSWRSTANGLEGLAAIHTDTALILDEIGQAPGRTIMEASYMLANGMGKTRADREGGSARGAKSWRCMVLSSGEKGLAEKILEEGGKVQAGQAVRLLDVPADAGMNMGVFETLYGHTNAQAFADAIKQAAVKSYGHAGPLFIEKLIENISDVKNFIKSLPALAEKLSGPTADGQVKRGAMRFVTCEVAGALAVHFGILPVTVAEVKVAIQRCFAAWLDSRGGTGPLEEMQLVERTRHFLEKHSSRFQSLDLSPPPQGVPLRAGFSSQAGGEITFYVLNEPFTNEICCGVPKKRAEQVLIQAGILLPDTGQVKRKIPKELADVGRPRCYALKIHVPDTGPVPASMPSSAPIQITMPSGWQLPTNPASQSQKVVDNQNQQIALPAPLPIQQQVCPSLPGSGQKP